MGATPWIVGVPTGCCMPTAWVGCCLPDPLYFRTFMVRCRHQLMRQSNAASSKQQHDHTRLSAKIIATRMLHRSSSATDNKQNQPSQHEHEAYAAPTLLPMGATPWIIGVPTSGVANNSHVDKRVAHRSAILQPWVACQFTSRRRY